MSNALTGDLDAVLRLNGRVLNRLLASMHQNDYVDPSRPSLPHESDLAIGYPDPVEGVQGHAHAQLSAPRIILIDGATDRFRIEVWARVHWLAAPGSLPLREFLSIHLTADYQASAVGDHCRPAPRRGQGPELWTAVLPDTITVDVTGIDDDTPFYPGPRHHAGDQELHDRVLAVLRHLLVEDFTATPHRLSGPFTPGSMICLNHSIGSEVVVPIPLPGGTTTGSVASVTTVESEGHDFAVSVSSDAVVKLVTAQLDGLASFHETIDISVDYWVHTSHFVYDVTVDQPTVSWHAISVPAWLGGSAATLQVTVTGRAVVDSSVAPDFTFSVTAGATLGFSAFYQRLELQPGSVDVSTDGSGVIGEVAEGYVGDEIRDAVTNALASACSQAQPQLAALTARTADLTSVLQSLDPGASVRLTGASFLDAGLTLYGAVSLAPLSPPQVGVTVDAVAGVHDAGASWIPGGRIDEYSWTWRPSTLRPHPGSSEDDTVRFSLGRHAAGRRPFGGARQTSRPLPGLDGSGTVCLRISGVQAHPVTGDLVPVSSQVVCTSFGVNPFADLGGPVVGFDTAGRTSKAGPQGLSGTMTAGGPGSTPANVLAVQIGNKGWDKTIGTTLTKGLAACARRDAGLAVLVLVPGRLAGDRTLATTLDRLEATVPAPVILHEDTDGAWAQRLYMPAASGEAHWRLIGPGGGIAWQHDGAATPDQLRAGLDDTLFPCPPVRPVALTPALVAGLRFPGSLTVVDGELVGCPAPQLAVRGAGDVAVVFVAADSAASVAAIEVALQEPAPSGGVVAVVDGAHRKEADRLRRAYGDRLTVLVDDDGGAAARAGVRLHPTTVSLTGDGIVRSTSAGVAPAITVEGIRS